MAASEHQPQADPPVQDEEAATPQDPLISSQQTVVWSPSDGRTITTTTTASPAAAAAAATTTTTATATSSSSPPPVVVASASSTTTTMSCNPKTIKDAINANLLPILTVSGVTGGIVLGLILRYSRDEPWTKREVMYVGYIGELFLRALKALIIPLIVSSLVSAIGSLDLSLSKKIGLRAVCYYLTTTVLAVVLGIILVVSIHPGKGSDEGITKAGEARSVYTPDLLMDLPRNFFPPNLIQACFETHKTVIVEPKPEDFVNDTRIEEWIRKYNWTNGTLPPKSEWDIKHEHARAMNIMGLVSFATFLGLALSTLDAKGKPLLDFFQSLSDASMVITSWLIWISPIGILFLVASMMIEMEDFSVMLGQLGMYFGTVVLGIFIHGFIVLPTLYTVFTRKLPFRFLANMSQAYITAFATASSSGTLPVTFQCLEEKNKIDMRVTRFVIPIGATINMDGTALYEAVAAIFIAQVRGLALSIGQVVAISITATAAAIGAAGIPQAGLVTMVMVLDVVGLPAEDMTLIIAVDWLLDRFRTMINVLGDSIGAGLVYELSKKELEKLNINANGDVERPSNEIGMDAVESNKM
ncbi:excitatory amino acid transporter 3-like isoform X4 [Portunus trituberculatus]|uniref:excitatory amino acid transporter 3-like isoform X4 n=1 Tax=Portunus trituberculatus TaxID=210409 RepID=UPI001E1CD244|nr:excitatory amino acid transporter 3-like isoform X4 [Portunus trituberculatus]